jgi:hypothetical protein
VRYHPEIARQSFDQYATYPVAVAAGTASGFTRTAEVTGEVTALTEVPGRFVREPDVAGVAARRCRPTDEERTHR